jgi:hypothetical protein
MRRALNGLALSAIGLFAAACAWLAPPSRTEPELSLGDALAQAACAVQVAEADAWINRMPSRDGRSHTLHVSVRLSGVGDTAVLTRSDLSSADVLVLDVRAADDAPIPGRMAFREPAPVTPYQRIDLNCRGSTIFRIDTIEDVF